MRAKLLGALGEARAAEYLKKKHLAVLAMNYRCREGEIDIIARDGKQTVFVEVKLRAGKAYAAASDYVDFRKQRKIKLAAASWLRENGKAEDEEDCRFDVIEVYTGKDGCSVTEINHLVDAF
jgi:putative endonuclease